MKILLIFFFISLSLLSINNSCTQSDKSILPKKPNEHEIIKIIPKNKYGGDYYPYKLVQKETKNTGMNFLDKGYDSIFIRLWYIYRSTIQVIDLKNSNGKWGAEIHNLDIVLVKNRVSAIKTKSSPVTPKSDWNVFMDKLILLNILDLPDDSELHNYDQNATDASFVIVEIATKERYKIYSYTEPYLHLQFPQAVNMEKIMELIEEEFGVKRSEKL